MDAVLELGRIVGPRNVISLKEDLTPFSRDKSFAVGALPLAAVRPANTSQVSRVLKLCNDHKINVVVRGGGSSLSGASVSVKNGIVMDMSYFSKILEIHTEDQYAIVEPGVIIDYLNGKLSKWNYFYPPEPASSSFATLGGTISTNAGGLRAVMYGSTKEWILGLEVVLPNGEIIQTGAKTLKRSVGYDLTSLIVGSEGTLGIVTKAIVKIIPKPEAVGRVVAYYRKLDDAISAVTDLKKKGLPLLCAELLDKSSIELIRKHRNYGIPKDANCMILIDLSSTKDSIERMTKSSQSILLSHHPIKVEKSNSKKDMERLYLARKSLYEIALELAVHTNRSISISDVVVPASQLARVIPLINEEIIKSGLEAQLFSHIGDGNIHVNVISGSEDIKKVKIFLEKLAKIALDHKGSVSGEHGIGLEKKELLIDELKKKNSLTELKMMREIKKVFDPNSILNPGKIFD